MAKQTEINRDEIFERVAKTMSVLSAKEKLDYNTIVEYEYTMAKMHEDNKLDKLADKSHSAVKNLRSFVYGLCVTPLAVTILNSELTYEVAGSWLVGACCAFGGMGYYSWRYAKAQSESEQKLARSCAMMEASQFVCDNDNEVCELVASSENTAQHL